MNDQQRPIKFRAWYHGTMYHYVECITYSDGSWGTGCIGNGKSRPFSPDDAGVTLLQFTGLLDKHGTEMYEGDIVRYLDNTARGLVEKTVVIEDIRSLPDFTCSKWQEVIGNVHEHPHLLHDGKCPECGYSLRNAKWHDIIHDAWSVTQANTEEGERQRKAARLSSLYAPNMGDKPIDYPLEHHEYQ